MKRTPGKKRQRMIARCSLLAGGLLALGTGLALVVSGCASSKPVTAKEGPEGVQSVRILVKHGYHPSHIEAKANQPLKLEFYRDEPAGKASCDDTLVIPSENVKIPLPAGESQIVEIKPQPAGDITFKCGMDMMHGKITFK